MEEDKHRSSPTPAIHEIAEEPHPRYIKDGKGDDSAAGSLDLNVDPCKISNSMEILREFNKIFDDRLAKVDQTQNSENIKYQQNCIYREWVSYLVEQNSDLIETVGDIEREACSKLSQLEGTVKEHHSVREKNLSNDLANLLEFIRRARDEGKWDADRLKFYCISPENLLGSNYQNANGSPSQDGGCMESGVDISLEVTPCEEKRNNEQPRSMSGLRSERVDVNIEASNIDNLAALNESNFTDIIAELKSANKQQCEYLEKLTANNQELERKCQRLENELNGRKKRVNEDTRELVQEVAERQDQISKYRAEISSLEKQLEEQLAQKDFHIQFKDKIIKELRRECKKNCEQPSSHLAQSASYDKSSFYSCQESTIDNMYEDSETDHQNIDFAHSTMRSNNPSTNIPKNKDLREQLMAKEKELNKRDAEQNRQLSVLDSMRSLVQSFRSVYEQLSDFENSQQKLHKSNSSLTLSGETSGFYSAETIMAPSSPNHQTEANHHFQSDMLTEKSRIEQVDSADDPNCLNDWEDGSTLVVGIQAVMQNMCARITNLTHENSQLIEDMVRLKEERESMEEIHDNEAEKHQMAFMDIAHVFSQLSETCPAVDDTQWNNKSVTAIANGNMQPIVELADHLKSNFQTKEQLLADQDKQIQNLQLDVMRLEKELFEMHKRGSMEEQERSQQHMETIDNLNKIVAVHKESLDKFQAAKLIQDKEIQELHDMIQAQHRHEQALLEKQRKLDNECKHQLVTILNLRTAIEDSSRQRATSTTNPASFSGHSSSSSPLMLHNDVQEAASAVSLLSEQLSSLFDENLTQQSYIQQLQDENLSLRVQLVECLQDIASCEKLRQRTSALSVDHVANYSDEVWRSLSSSSSTSSLSSAKSVLQLQDNYQPSIDPITYNNPSNSANNDLSYKLRILLANISEHKITNQNTVDRQSYKMLQLEQENQDILIEFTEKEERFKMSEETNRKLQLQVESLQTKLIRCAEIDKQHLRRINDLQSLNTELEIEIELSADKRIDSGSSHVRIQHLEAEIQSLIGERQRYQDLFQTSLNDHQNYQCKLQEENSQLQNEIKALKLDMTCATSNADSLRNEINRYRDRLKNANEIENQLASELNQNNDSVCSISGENSRLQSELDEFRSKHEAMKITYNEIHGKMVNDWTELRQTAETRLTMIRLHKQSIETITQANNDHVKKAHQMESEITELREHVSSLREDISELKGRESVRVSLLDTFQKDTSTIKSELERQRLLLNDSTRELLDCTQTNKDLIKSKDIISLNLHHLQEEYEALQNDYRDLKAIKEQVVVTLESNKSLVIDLHNRDQLNTDKIVKQNEHIDTLLEERNNLILKNKQLHRDMQIIQRQLQHCTSGDYNYQYPENDTKPTNGPISSKTQTQRFIITSNSRSTTRLHRNQPQQSEPFVLHNSNPNDSNEFYEMQQHRHASQMLQNLRIKREDMEDTLMSSNTEDADIG